MWSEAMKVWIVLLGLLLVVGVTAVEAQSAGAPADPHHPAASAPRPDGMAGPGDGAMMPMMDMCRQMMAGSTMGGPMMGGSMMGAPMMGMGGDQKMDPKMMGHMVEMRGEMMKAMGDVMMKHGRMMGEGATK